MVSFVRSIAAEAAVWTIGFAPLDSVIGVVVADVIRVSQQRPCRASDYPHAKRPLRVCGFDPTRGVSITVNIGTVALLYTLHETFDPVSLRGSKVS